MSSLPNADLLPDGATIPVEPVSARDRRPRVAGAALRHQAITVRRYHEDDGALWRHFLTSSSNGTLFHSLDFLAYHSPERFHVHHLMFDLAGKLLALLPAAIVSEPDGRQLLKSPYGGSVGGFVLPPWTDAVTTLALVDALKHHAAAAGLDGVEMRVGPGLYDGSPNDQLSFALTASGFTLPCRWLTHVISLPSSPQDVASQLVHKRRRNYVRSALNQGVRAATAGPEHLPAFYRILERNRAKHGARPTHTLSDLQRIFHLTPDRVRLFACNLRSEMIAGALVFELNPRVSYLFYLCHDDRFDRLRPATLATLRVAQHCSRHGVRYLDLGPTTFDDLRVNEGLARFKEEMGAVGFCRDTWRWERSA
jgi:hypothetical protein